MHHLPVGLVEREPMQEELAVLERGIVRMPPQLGLPGLVPAVVLVEILVTDRPAAVEYSVRATTMAVAGQLQRQDR
jgi:hypothetical protein